MSVNNLGFTREELEAAGAKFASPVPEPEEHITEEISVESSEVHDAAKNSLDFLAGLAMPTVFKYCYPPVLLAVWSWLVDYINKTRDFSQLALGLPRGFSKTTLMKLFVLFCILFTKRRFILVISSTATLAENFLSDVIDMLEEPNIKAVFGDWKIGLEKDTQAVKKFGYRGRNIMLAGLGAGTSLRGLNIKNERPDVMIFDDIQTREQAESQLQSDNLEKWLIGTAMKAKSPAGCLFVFVANMYPTKWSILRKLKSNARWTKFIAGGILADGTSLWEELQPIDQLMNEFQNDLEMGHPEIFYSEVLNDENATSNYLIDLAAIKEYQFQEDEIPQGKFIIIDPSGNKATSDSTAIGYFEVYDTIPVLKSLINERLSPGDTIRKALELALQNNCRLIAIESVAYQASLCYWFGFICEQMQIIGIEAVEVYPGSMSKPARIMDMFKSYSKGDVVTHPSVRNAVHLQMSQYNPLKKDNVDDVLDLLTYPHKVIEMFGDFVLAGSIEVQQEYGSMEVLPPELNCAF